MENQKEGKWQYLVYLYESLNSFFPFPIKSFRKQITQVYTSYRTCSGKGPRGSIFSINESKTQRKVRLSTAKVHTSDQQLHQGNGSSFYPGLLYSSPCEALAPVLGPSTPKSRPASQCFPTFLHKRDALVPHCLPPFTIHILKGEKCFHSLGKCQHYLLVEEMHPWSGSRVTAWGEQIPSSAGSCFRVPFSWRSTTRSPAHPKPHPSGLEGKCPLGC